MSRRKWIVVGVVALVVAVGAGVVVAVVLSRTGEVVANSWTTPAVPPLVEGVVTTPDMSAANRRAPIPGLPDWSTAGYREGAGLPVDADVSPDQNCRITADELGGRYGVRPNDNRDDSAGLQAAIDAVRDQCSAAGSYDKLSLITLPAGVLDVTRQLAVDADYLIIRGAGADPASGTRFVFRPNETVRYDTLTEDGANWDQDAMDHGDGKGGWIWPGRGLFRVQSRAVHPDYESDYSSAPVGRKDLFEGTVNVHWKSGVRLREKPGEVGFSARAGDRVIHLAEKSKLKDLRPGGYVNIRAANSVGFYRQQQALPTDHELQNLHMRQQIFAITDADEESRTITVDKPLEFDLPIDSTSDGSEEIDGKTYDSKAAPLVDPVLGVGFENFHITQDMLDLRATDAEHNYGNLAPADQMHGIVFKWVVNSWVRGVATYLTGSHPIVTEEAKNLEIAGNNLNGAWNKGKGGNGYLRGARVWDSLFAGNITRNLRHFTLQWSASGNVVLGNDVDSDLNLHGGWERRNLFELNTVRVPYQHRSANCRAACGDEGGVTADDSTWYPIWWGAGQKAVKWSGASGPQNVFFGNTMAKQLTENGEYIEFYPDRHRIYQFGWDGSTYRHLANNGRPIEDWAGNEQADYTAGNGVDASRSDPARSLFLNDVP